MKAQARAAVVAGCLALGATALAGAPGFGVRDARAAQATHASLAYTCQFPTGAYRITALVTTMAPATAPAGQPIRPFTVAVTTLLPAAAMAGFVKLGAASVKAADVLTVTEHGPAGSRRALWRAQGTSAYKVRDTGTASLLEPGTSPPIGPQRPGLLTVTARGLLIDLYPLHADGSPTTPAMVSVTCTPSSTRLAAITVTHAAPAPAGGQAKQKRKHRFPAGCGKIKEVGTGVATCAYVTGFADVAKLIGAALLRPASHVKPGLVNVDFAERHKLKDRKLIVGSTGELFFRGRHELPPVTATFLAFRFVPVTATLHLTELKSISIISASGITAPPFPITVTATTKVAVRITRVRVNGVPLDVGAACHTIHPITLVIVGKGDNTLPPRGYTVPTGGALSGNATIPPFVNCGTTENLDQLLTGSISGRGNFVKITQGKLCGPSQPENFVCPPPVPKPQR